MSHAEYQAKKDQALDRERAGLRESVPIRSNQRLFSGDSVTIAPRSGTDHRWDGRRSG